MQPSAAQDKDGLPVTTGRGGFKNSNPKHPLQERKCLLFLTQTFFFFPCEYLLHEPRILFAPKLLNLPGFPFPFGNPRFM